MVQDVQIASTVIHLPQLLVLCCSKLDVSSRDVLGRSAMRSYLAGTSCHVLPCATTDGEIHTPENH